MMHKLYLFFLFICALSMGANSVDAATIKPVNLRCDDVVNPFGIDHTHPRLSWNVIATKENTFANKQTGYRILVSTAESVLGANVGDMWDTGWVTSDQSLHIRYQGANLHPDRTYFWTVMVKDEKGKVSKATVPQHWTTGLFSNADWQADWIGADETYDPKQNTSNISDPWFRKNLTLKQKPTQANIYIASVGYHELYVNGKKIGDHVLAPVATDHSQRARYVAYDIASALQVGDNTIALWLGTGWSIYHAYATADKPRAPIVKAQVQMYDAQGQHIGVIKTDDSWKTHPSPNMLLGNWVPNNFGGELFDENKHIADWNQTSYQDHHWDKVQVFFPKMILSAQIVEGNIPFQEIAPKSIVRLDNGDFRIDMGENFAGWTEITVQGDPQSRIDFLFSERAQMEITFQNRSAYIIGASGKGTFKNRFNYSSGRWITIKGMKQAPAISDIKGWAIRTAYDPIAQFSCSDDLQTWIYDRTLWTFHNLSIGGMIVDCPQRERMGYGGDAHATSETGMLNFAMQSFYRKWMQDWQDVQGTEPMVGNMNDPIYARKKETSGRFFNNGILPHTAPTYWGGGGPSWGGIVVSLPWYYYQQYGDLAVLSSNFELIKGWLGFLDSHVEGDLLQRFGGRWDFLGDWLWPNATAEGMNNNKVENACFNNLFRVYNLRTAAQIARAIGEVEQARIWTADADRASATINQAYFDRQTFRYTDGSMANQALALLAGVPEEAAKQKVFEQLEKDILHTYKGHIHAGITGGAFLFKYLRQIDRHDLIYSMLKQTDYPSWGYMRANNATTIWEMWEKDLKGHSLLHSSFLFPGAWYIDGLSGLKPLSPGYKHFSVRMPHMNETDVNWAKLDFQSPMGLIRNHWERKDGQLRLEISVPPNTSAQLEIPVAERSLLNKKSSSVKFIKEEAGYVMYEVLSGDYTFYN